MFNCRSCCGVVERYSNGMNHRFDVMNWFLNGLGMFFRQFTSHHRLAVTAAMNGYERSSYKLYVRSLNVARFKKLFARERDCVLYRLTVSVQETQRQ